MNPTDSTHLVTAWLIVAAVIAILLLCPSLVVLAMVVAW